MTDLKDLRIEEVRRMIQNKTIGINDLSQYISMIKSGNENIEVREFLEEADKYINGIIDQNYNEDFDITNLNVSDGSSSSEDDIEKYGESTQQLEPVTDTQYPFFEGDDPYQEALTSVRETYNYCERSGLTVIDLSLTGKGSNPYITFEINNESKTMLDHLMTEFFNNNDGISLNLSRKTTNQEFLTLQLDDVNMSREELFLKVEQMFNKIYQTVETTHNDWDYEANMPDGLKNLKSHFRNDDPEIGQDFTIGYVKNDGKDKYYLVADDLSRAKAYAQSIGYDIKNSQGSNIFEIDTAARGYVNTDTKLTKAAIELVDDDKVTRIDDVGITDLDIYGALQVDPKTRTITGFIEEMTDPHVMGIISIDVPKENPSQRVVHLNSDSGFSERVVFSDGGQFDNQILPVVINTYSQNNEINDENILVSRGSFPHTFACQIETENNTTMFINGYDENKINGIVNTIHNNEVAKGKINEKGNQKRIGTYPSSQEVTSAFISTSVLLVVCLLFLLLLSLLIFAV